MLCSLIPRRRSGPGRGRFEEELASWCQKVKRATFNDCTEILVASFGHVKPQTDQLSPSRTASSNVLEVK